MSIIRRILPYAVSYLQHSSLYPDYTAKPYFNIHSAMRAASILPSQVSCTPPTWTPDICYNVRLTLFTFCMKIRASRHLVFWIALYLNLLLSLINQEEVCALDKLHFRLALPLSGDPPPASAANP
jgi:hypothetical protein